MARPLWGTLRDWRAGRWQRRATRRWPACAPTPTYIEQALAFRSAVDGLAARPRRPAGRRRGLAAIAAAAEAVAAAPDDAALMAADTAFHLELAWAGGSRP